MNPLRPLALLAAVLAAPLAACDSPETAVHYSPKEPRADRATALHGVSFAPSQGDLSGQERYRLAAFVQRLPADRTRVSLLTPDSSPIQAQRTAAIRGHLHALGVPVEGVRPAQGLAVGPDTVVVSAESYSARNLNCPDWSKNSTYDPLNLPGSNLGCATARNIGDMVADPRDLEMGRTPGPGSGHLGASAVDRLYNDKVKGANTSGASGSGVSTPGAGGGGGTN
jgi:pilus assembly protein CpaD